MKTRTIHDRHDPGRRHAANDGTRILDLGGAFEPRPLPELFRACYPNIRAACRHALAPGVVLVSVDGPSGAVGYVGLAARPDRPAAAIVGRHGQADLRLPLDPRISLRHLALILLPGARPRVLLLDLFTGRGFEDERGVSQLGVLADGPILFRLGRYALFLLESGLARSLPADADEAWARLPERIYEDRTPRSELRMGPAGALDPRREVTLVSRVGAPRLMQRSLLERGEAPLGELRVHARRGGLELVRLGPAAAARGVLVGRYERCATSLIREGALESVSRVHLLAIKLEGAMFAIDTASTNGTWLGGEQVRLARLEPGVKVVLADEAGVEWRVLN